MIGQPNRPIGPTVWKPRCGPAGLHLFDRSSGLNVLLDEIEIPTCLWSQAPRQFSIALTNDCDSDCPHCFAPKTPVRLHFEDVKSWLLEMDTNGCLGVGFGGGEPTLFPEFSNLCRFAGEETGLAVTFTTHGHHVDERLAEEIHGYVHFIRVSMDGVGQTYEAIRKRPFASLLRRLDSVASIAPFGINLVVNAQTLSDIDSVLGVAEEKGAAEVLLLPECATRGRPGIDDRYLAQLRRRIAQYRGGLRLTISEACRDGFLTCDPTHRERGLRGYVHIDASGTLKATSFHRTGIQIESTGVLEALQRLAYASTEEQR